MTKTFEVEYIIDLKKMHKCISYSKVLSDEKAFKLGENVAHYHKEISFGLTMISRAGRCHKDKQYVHTLHDSL